MDNGLLGFPAYETRVREFIPRCDGCLDLDSSILDWRAVPWATTYPSFEAHKIVQGKRKGCSSCSLIYDAFESIALCLDTVPEKQDVGIYKPGHNSLLRAHILLDDKYYGVEFFQTDDLSPSPWSLIDRGTHLIGDTASEASFNRILEWIGKCRVGHGRCSNTSNGSPPTRILDLGHSNDSIKLSPTDHAFGQYICLSHCWGKAPTIFCTRENYEDYQKNIPWASLPLLFQQCIQMCRKLEIQYLWIDKLCIIQGDKDDWAAEGSRMAQIFEGSFLTIAATIPEDDTYSLFFNDGKYFPSLRKHVVAMKDGSSSTIYSRIPMAYHPADGSFFGRDGKIYSLMSRAWVLQERLLPPRVLYFGEELSWECREASLCECSGVDDRPKVDHSLSLSPETSLEKLYEQWQRTVEGYVTLQLSFEEDRLPAISGLAQQYQHRLKSMYLAGLWRDNLPSDLLWFAKRVNRHDIPYRTRKTKVWRAPSWSWASVEGGINFPTPFDVVEREKTATGLKSQIEIVSAECVPSSLDPMGMVAKGHLVLKGKGRVARLRHRELNITQQTRHWTIEVIDSRRYSISSNFTVEEEEANVDYDLIEAGLMSPNSDMEIFCFWVSSITESTIATSEGKSSIVDSITLWSLLLRRIDDQVFERIGLMQTFAPPKIEDFLAMTDYTITIV